MLGFPRHLFPISCWHVGVPPRPQPMNELSQIVSCSHVHKQATWMPRPHIKFSHGGGKSLAASALGTLTWLLIQHLHQNDQLIVQRHRRLLIQNLEQKNCQLSVQSHWRLIQYLQTVFHCQRHHHHQRPWSRRTSSQSLLCTWTAQGNPWKAACWMRCSRGSRSVLMS